MALAALLVSSGVLAGDAPFQPVRSRRAGARTVSAERPAFPPRPTTAPVLLPIAAELWAVPHMVAQGAVEELPSPAAEGPALPFAPAVEPPGGDAAPADVAQPGEPMPPVEPAPYPELVPRPESDAPPKARVPLKSIGEIQPFFDYEPDPQIRREDPYRNLCPRPSHTGAAQHPECPEMFALPGSEGLYRGPQVPPSVYTWTANNLWYYPLYFQDFDLERYGHTYSPWIQPFQSVARFSVQLVGLPYQMTIQPICQHTFPLGYYRPGEHTPRLFYQIPWSTKAAINEAAVVTGMVFLLP